MEKEQLRDLRSLFFVLLLCSFLCAEKIPVEPAGWLTQPVTDLKYSQTDLPSAAWSSLPERGALKAAACLHGLVEEDVRTMCRIQNWQKRLIKIAVTAGRARTKSAPALSG